jgi:uncharacterized protein (TIGR03437 family)
MRVFVYGLLLTSPLLAQSFDTSNDAALKGSYFVREVLINSNGTTNSGSSAIGVATFNGAGNYTFAGTAGQNNTGTYGLGANGLLYIQSFVDGTQYAYGGISAIGPNAFVASATEGPSADIIVAIPAGTSSSAASLNGNYSAGYVGFANNSMSQLREASLTFSANGSGNLTNATLSGVGLDLGGKTVTQTISGATYSLSGQGSGTLILGSSSTQVLAGSMNLYLSADGNLFLAGTPGGIDLIVGARSFSGSAGNSNWNNVYFIGGFEDYVSNGSQALDAFYGSWNANGQGSSIVHERYQQISDVFDYTFASQDSVLSNGISSPADIPYQITLAAGGQVFIATGTQGLYSLMIGFAAPQFSGSGVYLNPLGVVNAANYAPITNPIAPQEIVSLFGSGLASGIFNASGLPLSTSLGGVQVTVNGELAPLVYVSPTQITFVVPQDVTPNNGINLATIQVNNNGALSNTSTVYTNYTAPGMFAAGAGGTGPAAAQLNNSPVSSTNPVNIGSTVTVYATGLGTVTPIVPDGAAAPSNPPATTDDLDYVFVGGQQENIQFNGLTPGFAALFQINESIVSGTPTGLDFADISTPDAYTSEATLGIGASASLQIRKQARKSLTKKRPGLADRAKPKGTD